MFLLTVMLFLRCHFLALLWKIGFPEDDSLRKQSYTSYRPILQHFVHTPEPEQTQCLGTLPPVGTINHLT